MISQLMVLLRRYICAFLDHEPVDAVLVCNETRTGIHCQKCRHCGDIVRVGEAVVVRFEA